MIRRDTENDNTYLGHAFDALKGEPVAHILIGAQRENQPLLARAVGAFGIDPTPFLVHPDQTVYVSRARRAEYFSRLFNVFNNDVTFANPAEHPPVISLNPSALCAPRAFRRYVWEILFP